MRKIRHQSEWKAHPSHSAQTTPLMHGAELDSFHDHRIVKINGKYYDPSYGNQFESMQAWEDGSVEGFYRPDVLPGNATWRLVFRKNPAGLNIRTVPANA